MNGKEKNYSRQTGVEYGFPGEFAFMIKRGYAWRI